MPYSYSLSYEGELKKAVGTNCKTILDVVAAFDSPMKVFSGKFYLVGVDAHKPSIERSLKLRIHNKYFNMPLSCLTEFGPESFDCVVALDVIEHLSKNEGLRFLDNVERIAKKKIIVFTPNGFLPQYEYDDNPMQKHRSGWTATEMKLRGYRVTGIRGLKILRGEQSIIKFKPKSLWELTSILTQYIVRNQPEFAFQILCTKTKTNTL